MKGCIFTDIDEWYPEPEDSGRDLLRGTKDAVVSQISETLGFKNNKDHDRNLGGLLDFNLFGHPFCEPYVKMKETFIWVSDIIFLFLVATRTFRGPFKAP